MKISKFATNIYTPPDEDCSPTVQPFPTLSGEALEYIGLLAPDCHIAISNYRFFVAKDDGFYNVRHYSLYSSRTLQVILKPNNLLLRA